MQKNVLIGIGGTGSRVIESVVHLCAAGLGPDVLHIFLIDPDQGNGNLTHTKTLIKNYTSLRKLFYEPSSGNPSFKTEIVIPPDDKFLAWGIFDETTYTLAKYINHDNLKKNDPELADLANVLFTRQELQTELNEGFRGHPSIGAVVMANPPMDEYPFKLLWDDTHSLGANQLRVFLVGSIFGGTGAAGFPTLGSRQLIKYNEKAKIAGEKSKVLLGGALILPYFSFAMDSTIDEPMFVTTNDFPIATKAALQYYNDKQLGFDQFYFIGDSLLQKVGKFSTGSSTQDNYPHYIEMVSGLACFDFFRQPPPEEEVPDKKYFISCREDEKLSWNMLPVTRNSSALQEERKKLKDRIVDFTVFAYSYLTFGKSILSGSHKDALLEAWYGDNFKKDFKEDSAQFNPRHTENNNLYKLADDFLNDFLFWICAIDNGDNIELIDRKKILNSEVLTRNHLVLKDPQHFKANIGLVVKGKPAGLDFNSFKVQGLQEAIIQDKSMAAGKKFLNAFYFASAKFNKKNLVTN